MSLEGGCSLGVIVGDGGHGGHGGHGNYFGDRIGMVAERLKSDP